jgi:hypothetical protein
MSIEPETSDEPQPAPWDRPQQYADQLRAQGVDDETAVASGWHKAIRESEHRQ